jgi:hypothetical protein
MENSPLMAGRARLTDDAIRGVRNEAAVHAASAAFLSSRVILKIET